MLLFFEMMKFGYNVWRGFNGLIFSKLATLYVFELEKLGFVLEDMNGGVMVVVEEVLERKKMRGGGGGRGKEEEGMEWVM